MNQLLIDLKNKLNPIVELIKDKNDVFYFDYPLHLNVGDLLIYHGTEQFFKDHHINVTLKRCEYDLDLEEVKAKLHQTPPSFYMVAVILVIFIRSTKRSVKKW